MIDDNDLGYFTVFAVHMQPGRVWCGRIASVLQRCSLSSANKLCWLQNWLGVLIMVLVVAYHFFVADPKLEQQ